MDVHMNELLQATIDEGGSDLHIRARMPPELRVHGELCPLSDEALTEEDSYNLVREISTDEQMEEVEKNGGADFALAHPDGTRFRVSVFKERKRYGAVLRQIPSTLLTLEQIGIPITQYQKYLLVQQTELPVICAGAYVDKNGKYYAFDQPGAYSQILNDYNILEYNHLIDIKNRVTGIFTESLEQ